MNYPALQFAIIGCGRIAERHARQISALGSKLVAVCDRDPQRALDFGLAHGARPYPEIGLLLDGEKELDIVVVCTPNGLHAEHSIRALQAGFHVICEKPMALHVSDCRDMLEAARLARRQLFVVKQNRFNPPVKALKGLLVAGRLGRIYSVHVNCLWNRNADYYSNSWKGTMDLDGGILYTQFSHFIDLLYWMIGDITDVKAFTANLCHQGFIEFEDTGVACFQFENGALGTLHVSINAYLKNMEGSLTILAEKGSVKVGGEYLNLLEYQLLEGTQIPELSSGNSANDYGTYRGSMSNHDKVYAHVREVIAAGAPNRMDGQEGLKTVEIIEKIYAAAHGSHH